MKNIKIALVILLAVCMSSQGKAQAKMELMKKSQRVATLISKDSGYVVEAMTAKVFKDALESGGATLGGVYTQITGNMGTLKRLGETRYMAGGYFVPFYFDKDSVFLQLHYDAASALDGLYFRPKMKKPVAWKLPEYALAGSEERFLSSLTALIL
jgi:hypothetical protein